MTKQETLAKSVLSSVVRNQATRLEDTTPVHCFKPKEEVTPRPRKSKAENLKISILTTPKPQESSKTQSTATTPSVPKTRGERGTPKPGPTPKQDRVMRAKTPVPLTMQKVTPYMEKPSQPLQRNSPQQSKLLYAEYLEKM